MPAAPVQQTPFWAYPFLAAFCAGVLYLFYLHPLIIAGVAALLWCFNLLDRRFRRKLASSRVQESICTFARSFDRREVDPWLLRAAYEELSQSLAVDGCPTPIRAADRWEKDLKIDGEDMWDLVMVIAVRAGRDLEGVEQNPYWPSVQKDCTIRDLISLLQHQPKKKETKQSFVC